MYSFIDGKSQRTELDEKVQRLHHHIDGDLLFPNHQAIAIRVESSKNHFDWTMWWYVPLTIAFSSLCQKIIISSLGKSRKHSVILTSVRCDDLQGTPECSSDWFLRILREIRLREEHYQSIWRCTGEAPHSWIQRKQSVEDGFKVS